MCVDFTNVNNAYSNDLYPLSNINVLVGNASRYELHNFIDVYSGYN